MAKSVFFTRTWMGLGLAAGLLLGCQQFLGQEEKAPVPAGDAASDPPEDMALKLTMKGTAECRALRDQVLAADAAGQVTVTLQTDFIRNCIVEARSADSSGKVVIPADLLPDDSLRCRWLVSGIDGGREELVIKFRYDCPDDCDSLSRADSVRHGRICRDPMPECADLRAKLASLDTGSMDYDRLRRLLSERCGVHDTLHPPKDTSVAPAPCDSLKRLLATVDTSSVEHDRILALLRERCGRPDTLIRPPAPFPCDSLKLRLARLDTGSTEYAHVLALLKACPSRPDSGRPVLTFCDSLKLRLGTLDSASEDYHRILRILREKCWHPDTGIVKPLPPERDSLPITSLLLCDSLRQRMASLDPSSVEYGKTKQQWYQQCLEPKPVNDSTLCGDLVSRLEGMDTTSREYPLLRHEAAIRCPAWLPAEPVQPVDPVPLSPECADIQKRMSRPGLSHEEYSRLKQLFSEKCFR